MRVLLPALLLLIACGPERDTLAPSTDAGDESEDAGKITRHDAGPLDSGPASDAGGTEPDAGERIDAGSDAGHRDAGPFDAGPRDAGSPDAGPADAGALDAGPVHVAFCQLGCTTSSDCVPGNGQPPFAASNYACRSGLCEYTGCHSDQECQTGLQDSSQVCRTVIGVPTCQRGCNSTSTCGYPPAGGAFASDRYACTNGICDYRGCTTDQQCFTTYSSTNYHCREQPGLVPMCYPACSTAADCGSPVSAYDSSHYACESSICRYTGCRSDQECASSFSDARYICR